MDTEEKQEQLYKQDTTLKKELNLTKAETIKKGFFTSLKKGLQKTKSVFVDDLKEALVGDQEIDEQLFDKIEAGLLTADLGVATSRRILNHLEELYSKGAIKSEKQAFKKLQEIITNILSRNQTPLNFKKDKCNVVLFVGVNGVGKTTSIGKIAWKLKQEGKKVLLAAGDTFRAAAIEQLKIWATRSGVDIVAKEMGSDAAATVYTATEKAIRENYDFLLCDTSGRLHNNKNLMNELEKIKKVIQKLAPEELQTILILDASTGQNAVQQVKIFKEILDINGLIITKLDGTSKGGVIIGLLNEFELPLYYLGVGEKIEQLQNFEPKLFAEALFSTDS